MVTAKKSAPPESPDTDGKIDTANADEAVVEIIDPKKTASVTFADTVYTFPRKRLDARFRLLLQKNQDMLAFERLLGADQFERFMVANEDEDGCVSFDVYGDFAMKVSEALSTGN